MERGRPVHCHCISGARFTPLPLPPPLSLASFLRQYRRKQAKSAYRGYYRTHAEDELSTHKMLLNNHMYKSNIFWSMMSCSWINKFMFPRNSLPPSSLQKGRWCLSTKLYHVTSKKPLILILTAVNNLLK